MRALLRVVWNILATLSLSLLARGLHCTGVRHAESAADLGPGVPRLARLGDEFRAFGGHRIHTGLERGELV